MNCRHFLPSDPDDKGQFGLSWHIVVSNFASIATHADLAPVHLPVLCVVLLSPLVDQLPGHFTGLSAGKDCTPINNALKTEIRPYSLNEPRYRNSSLPFFQPASSWCEWPSWWRRPFAFSKGSQGPPEPFFCCKHNFCYNPKQVPNKSYALDLYILAEPVYYTDNSSLLFASCYVASLLHTGFHTNYFSYITFKVYLEVLTQHSINYVRKH